MSRQDYAAALLQRVGLVGVESSLRVLWPRRHGSAGSKCCTRALIRVDLAALRIARAGEQSNYGR